MTNYKLLSLLFELLFGIWIGFFLMGCGSKPGAESITPAKPVEKPIEVVEDKESVALSEEISKCVNDWVDRYRKVNETRILSEDAFEMINFGMDVSKCLPKLKSSELVLIYEKSLKLQGEYKPSDYIQVAKIVLKK